MIDVQVDANAITAKLENFPANLNKALFETIARLTERLRDHVVNDKLQGQVLNRITGRLSRAIKFNLSSESNSVTGTVFVGDDVPYARIHEYGGQTAAHVIEARNGKVLAFMMNGKQVFAKSVNHPGSKMPERSYLRSSLADMKEEIIAKIGQTVNLTANE